MFNNQLIIDLIEGVGSSKSRRGTRQRIGSEPLLIERLPNLRTTPPHISDFEN